MPRPGRTLAVAVYRPLAEQLAGLAAPVEGEHVLELSAGDGELTTRLTAAVGARGTVEVLEAPWNVAPTPQHHVDLAVSLLAIETQDELADVLPQLALVARRTLVMMFAGGATYDNALATAWQDVMGSEVAALPATDPVAKPTGWRQQRLSDVARFDGVDQLLTALTDERAIEVPADRRAALRERLAEALRSFTAADGTMRIPVHATVVEHG